MPDSKSIECYCCSSPGTTVEHIPPRCFFPKSKYIPNNIDHRKQLITVPSCEQHNSAKSKDDEYACYMLTMTLDTNETGTSHFENHILKQVDRRPHLINNMLENSIPCRIKQKHDDDAWETVAITVQSERIHNYFAMLGLGLYYHHFKRKWYGITEAYLEFLSFTPDNDKLTSKHAFQDFYNLADILFRNAAFYGENPDVFRYQIIEIPERPFCMARLHFYGNTRVLLNFSLHAT